MGNLTHSQTNEIVGATGTLRLELNNGTMYVPVTITDVRQGYGRFDLRVEPTLGGGYAWVYGERVDLDDADLASMLKGGD